MAVFENDKLYRPHDVEREGVAARQTLARWRCEGRGPRFLRLGSRIAYEGKDLNNWLDAQASNSATELGAP